MFRNSLQLPALLVLMAAAAIGYGLNHALMPEQMSEWGWRVPFFIGCALVPFLFYIRNSLEETKAFAERKHRPEAAEIFRTLAANWRIVLLGMLMMITRHNAISQLVGLLSLENGLVLAASGVRGMPLVLELSTAALVLMLAAVAGFFVFRLRESLSSLDVSALHAHRGEREGEGA